MSPEDNAPEFQATTVPPGTAPKENLFQPKPTETIPGQGLNEQVLGGHGKESTHTTASSTLGGATSADVDTGMGKQMGGQTSTEIHHDAQHHKKKPGSGLEGVGASGKGTNVNLAKLEREDEIDQNEKARQRGISAEDRLPESDDLVAAERQRHGGKPHHGAKPSDS